MTVDPEVLIERALRIQSVPAPTFGETQRAVLIRDEFAALGSCDVEVDPMGNVYARRPGGRGRPVVVTAHLDTVFPVEMHVPARREGGRLLGPGIGDNAVALAALVEIGRLAPPDLPGDLWLVANVCEEGLGNLEGMKAVADRFQELPLAYLVLEGMAYGLVFHRSLPSRRYRITVATPGGHSWLHAGRPSAVHGLIEIGRDLLAIDLPRTPRSVLNIGSIQGGMAVNAIASSAQMEVDLRCETAETLDRLAARLERAVSSYVVAETNVKCEKIGERPAGSIPHDHPLVAAAVRAWRTAADVQARLDIGSTDASLPLSRGLPAVCTGLTRGSRPHSQDESIELEPLRSGFAAIQALVRAAFDIQSHGHP